MTYVVAASKSGKNVLTATDPNDFIFHSSYNTFKIVEEDDGNFSIPANTENEAESIDHNNGTRRGFLVYFKFPSGKTGYDENKTDNTGAVEDIYVARISNSANTITMRTRNNLGTAQTVYYKYYLFEVPL
jgi:hypothetical protein